METLPLEVVTTIAKYLPVKDLAACCAVSPWWRDVFGSDVIWRPRCDKDLEEYLSRTPCRVEPKFETPECEQTTLSPIGRWRTAYMRETHLWRNWICGNFVEYKFDDFIPRHRIILLNNDLVIIGKRDKIELKDATVNPPVCLAEVENPPNYGPYSVKAVGSHKFITFNDWSSVRVVEVEVEPYNLSVKLEFNVGEGRPITIFNCVFFNNVFLAKDYTDIHIWNLEGEKLKTSEEGFNDVIQNEICEDVIIEETTEIENMDHRYLVYNMNRLSFWSFKKDCSGFLSCAIVKSYIAFFVNRNTEVYNYETSHLIHNIALANAVWLRTLATRDSFIFFIDYKIWQLFPSTGAMRSVSLPSGICSINFYTDKVCFLFENGGFWPKCLWKVGSMPLVTTLQPRGDIYIEVVNQNCSEVFMARIPKIGDFSSRGQLSRLYFW